MSHVSNAECLTLHRIYARYGARVIAYLMRSVGKSMEAANFVFFLSFRWTKTLGVGHDIPNNVRSNRAISDHHTSHCVTLETTSRLSLHRVCGSFSPTLHVVLRHWAHFLRVQHYSFFHRARVQRITFVLVIASVPGCPHSRYSYWILYTAFCIWLWVLYVQRRREPAWVSLIHSHSASLVSEPPGRHWFLVPLQDFVACRIPLKDLSAMLWEELTLPST